MAENWNTKSNGDRGRWIRWVMNDLARVADNNNAIDWSVAAGDRPAFWNMADHPSRTQVNGFKNMLMVSYREYLDSLYSKFKPTVSDEAIGALGGTNINLQAGTAAGFFEIQGTGQVAPDSQETGDAHKQFIRSLNESAIKTPDAYVTKSNEALDKIDSDSMTVYTTSMNKYYKEYKYPFEEAKRMALADKKKYADILKEQHKLIYKHENYEKAAGKIYKNA